MKTTKNADSKHTPGPRCTACGNQDCPNVSDDPTWNVCPACRCGSWGGGSIAYAIGHVDPACPARAAIARARGDK